MYVCVVYMRDAHGILVKVRFSSRSHSLAPLATAATNQPLVCGIWLVTMRWILYDGMTDISICVCV